MAPVAPRLRGLRFRPVCMSFLKPLLGLTLPVALTAGLIMIAQQYGRAPLAIIGACCIPRPPAVVSYRQSVVMPHTGWLHDLAPLYRQESL